MPLKRFVILSGILAMAPMARAVIVMGPQGRNTSAPTGTLSTAGWQYEAQFGPFLATPISSDLLITAKHLGGDTSTPITFDNVSYTIDSTFDGGTGYYNIPGTDLNIWKVTGTFPTYAPLYGGGSLTYGSEVGKNMFVVGRGVQRGEPLTLANARLLSGDGTTSLAQSAMASAASLPDDGATDPKGWLWGANDGVQSWGTNIVSGTSTDPMVGKLITFAFNENAGPNTAALATNDSGGGLFVDVTGNGDWRLAGINYAADGHFQGSAGGTSFDASLYDAGGLWESGNPPTYIPDESENIPTNSYDSPISANYDAIEAVIDASDSAVAQLPEPASIALLGITAFALRRRVRR